MKNRELIRRIERGSATIGQLRMYADRVSSRMWPDYCQYGHLDCALVPGGPCLNEVLNLADYLDEEQNVNDIDD